MCVIEGFQFFYSYSQLSDSQFEQILRGEADLEEFVPNKKEEKEKQ